jgi:fibronectin-binding autotransporter adhesin
MKLRVLAAALVVLSLSAQVHATFTWSGLSTTDGSAADATNWTLLSPPTGLGGEDVIFGDISGAQTTVLLPSVSLNNITFNGSSRPHYLFSGLLDSQTLSLTGGINVATTGDVELDSSLDLDLSAVLHALSVTGSSLVQFNGTISGSGASVSISGPGSVTLSGANTFSGGLTLDSGTLNLGRSTNSDGGIISGPVGTGTLTLNSGALVANVEGVLTLANPIVLGGTVSLENAFNLTGIISGAGSFSSDGTITLTGDNTYTGGTQLFAGSIYLGHNHALGTGTLTIPNSSAGYFLVPTSGSDLTIENPIALDTSMLSLGDGDSDGVAAYDGIISGSGSVRILGSTTLNGANTYSGGTKLQYGRLTIGNNAALGTGDLKVSAGSEWTQIVGSNATTTLGNNIVLNTAPGDPGIILSELTIGDGESSNAFVLNGNISGGGELEIKTPTALNGNNTYTGGTDIINTTVDVGHDSGLGATSSYVYLNNSTVNFHTTAPSIGDLSTGISEGPSHINLLAGHTTLTINQGMDETFNGSIHDSDGTSGIALTGGYDLLLTQASDYGGATHIQSGSITYGIDNALPTGTAVTIDGAPDVESPTPTLDLQYFNGTIGSLAGAGQVNLSTGTTWEFETPTFHAASLTIGTNNADTTFSGTISSEDENNLIKVGTGTLTLTGNSDYTGQTFIKNGTIAINTIQSMDYGSSSLGNPWDIPMGTIALGDNDTTGTLKFIGSDSEAATTDRPIDLAGTTGGGTLDASGTVPISFTSTFMGIWDGETYRLSSAGTKTFTLTGTNTGANTFAAPIVNYGGVTSLTKSGIGTWVLTGQSTYTGDTSILGGKLSIGTTNALPTTTKVNLSSGASLDVANNQTIERFLSSVGSEIAIASGKTFTIDMSDSSATGTQYDGVISGLGSLEIGASNKTVALNGANTYAGGTTIDSGGSLQIGTGSTTGFVPGDILNNGALGFNRSDTLTINGAISGTGYVNNFSGTTVLGHTNTYSGGTEIYNGSALVASASGAFGTGGITVSSGKLGVVNGAVVSNTLTLQNAKLIGTGTFNSPVTIGTNMALSPESAFTNNSIGTLGFQSLTLAGGGGLEWNLVSPTNAGVGYDLISISGQLAVSATSGTPFTIKLVSLSSSGVAGTAFGFQPGTTYTFDAFQAGSITGFNASSFSLDTTNFTVNGGFSALSLNQVGNNLQFSFTTPVPEPSTWALFGSGLAVLAFRLRRKRR